MCVFLPVRKSQGKTPIWNSANVPGVWTYESSEWVTQTPKPNPQNLLSFHYLNTKDVVKRGSKVRQRTRHTIKQTGVTIVTNPPCRDDRWTSVGCYLHTCIMLLLPTDTTTVIMSRLQQRITLQINTDNMQGGTIRQTCMWDTVNLFWCKLSSCILKNVQVLLDQLQWDTTEDHHSCPPPSSYSHCTCTIKHDRHFICFVLLSAATSVQAILSRSSNNQ